MTCTFFGHRSVLKEVEPLLTATLIDLIENKNVDRFYVGNHGGFDFMVQIKLKDLRKRYPHIKYYVVLAYIPTKKYEYSDYSDTIYPSVLDGVPAQAKIVERNKWMIKNSDFVVTHVLRSIGGAAEFKALAEKKGKVVINLTNP